MLTEVQKERLCEQLLIYGYFSTQIPPCFTTGRLVDIYTEVKNELREKLISEPIAFTVPKKNGTRREIKLPNPEQQLILVKYMIEYIGEIKKIMDKSKNSLSSPFYTRSVKNQEVLLLDIPHIKDRYTPLNSTIENTIQRIKASMGYKYCLKIDLATFYERIYTPIIEWLIVGRNNVENNYESDNMPHKIARAISNTNFGEEAGIPTGPYTSRIISELIMVKVDETLASNGFIFKRYVDDYEFYFRTQEEIENNQVEIENCLREYKLHINDSKKQILQYPYHKNINLGYIYSVFIDRVSKLEKLEKDNEDELVNIFFDIEQEKTNRYEKEKKRLQGKKKEIIIQLFLKADELYNNSIHGAYKYLFKVIKNMNLSDVWSDIEGFIVNTILINPGISQYLVSVIKDNIEYISDEFKEQILVNLKRLCVRKFDNEVQWLFWILKEINYEVDKDDILFLIDHTKDDILILMLIDYCNEIYKYNTEISEKIKSIITKLGNVTSMQTSKWLIIYECFYNDYFNSYILEDVVKQDTFFNLLYTKKVNFFNVDYALRTEEIDDDEICFNIGGDYY